MANGMHAHENIPAVKKTIYDLETSPSCHSDSSPIAHGGTRATGHGSSTPSTGKLSAHSKGHVRGKPKGSRVAIGEKKNHMHQKSTGR